MRRSTDPAPLEREAVDKANHLSLKLACFEQKVGLDGFHRFHLEVLWWVDPGQTQVPTKAALSLPSSAGQGEKI